MNKRLSLFFLCAAFGITAFLILDEWRFEKLSGVKKMQQLWEQDIELMEDNHQLPAAWFAIREIELSPGSPEALDWLKHLQVPVVIDKKGDFKLQVLFLPWIEEGKQGWQGSAWILERVFRDEFGSDAAQIYDLKEMFRKLNERFGSEK